MTPAVVLGLSPTGLYAIRELGRRGVPVLGVGAEAQSAARSRFLTWGPRCIVEPDEGRRLARLLEAFPEGGSRAVLIPTSDQDIDFVVRHRETLSSRFVTAPCYTDGAYARVLSKASFYAACLEADVPTPSYWEARTGDLAALREKIVYPCLVKPSEIHEVKAFMAGRKVLLAPDAASFDAIVSMLPDKDVIWLVQEIIPGPESSITLFAAYFDGDGKPRQAFTARKLRQFPPGFGSASLVSSETLEETRVLSERLLAAIGFRGIGAAEFKRDPRDGRLKAIEVNARPSLWFSLTTACGKEITLDAWRDLSGQSPLADSAQRDGVRWRYLFKDFYSALFYLNDRSFILPRPEIAPASLFQEQVTPVLDFSDPLPSLDELLTYIRKAVRRISFFGRRGGQT